VSSATLDAVLPRQMDKAAAASDVRAWARSQGLAVNARGPLSANVLLSYEEAHRAIEPVLRATQDPGPTLTSPAMRRVPTTSRPAASMSSRWPSAGLMDHEEPDDFRDQSDAAWDARFARWQDAGREPEVAAPRAESRAARWVRFLRSATR
jgi:hypothetical protein